MSLTVFPRSTHGRRAWILLFVIVAAGPLMVSAQSGRGLTPVAIATERGEQQLYERSYALIIANGDYTAGWPDLPGVGQDATEVATALESHGFAVTIERNLDSASLYPAVFRFIASRGQDPQNRIVIFYSGHGHSLELAYGDTMGYLVPTDAPNPNRDVSGFLSSAMAMQQIDVFARQIQSKHALFLFDSCFSGSVFSLSRAIPESISYKTSEPVRQFITAGSEDQEVPDESVFADQFIRALAGDGDVNGDGYVTGTELGEFLQDTVVNYTRNAQTPQYGKIRDPRLDRGDIVFPLAGVTPGRTDLAGVRTGDGGSTQETAARLGSLLIESDPLGVSVTVDGVERGVTPLFLDDIPTDRLIRVEARDGTMSAGQEVRASAGDIRAVTLVLEQEVGNLVLLTAERGLEVFVDGERMGTLQTSLLPGIPAGTRTLRLSGNGLYWEATVEVLAEANTQLVPEYAEVGTLSYDLPAGARATVTPVAGSGAALPAELSAALRGAGRVEHVPTGRYEVGLVGVASGDESFSVSLARGQTVSVAPRVGALRIESTPSGATVTLAGRQVGTTPVTLYDLAPGQVSYRLALADYEDATGSATVVAGRVASATVTMPEPTGSLRIVTTPAGAEVYVDGRRRGTTPITIEAVEPGSRQIELRLDGYEAREFRQTVAAGRTASRTETLVAEEPEWSLHTILVQGGSFQMGSASGGDSDERPVRTVTVDSFRMTTTEVTVASFRRFVDAIGYRTTAESGAGGYVWTGSRWEQKSDAHWRNPYFSQDDDHPVVLVSWYDAVTYANWLSEQDGLTPAYRIEGTNVTWNRSANGWRLPTEAEWEYAARGGTQSRGYTYAGTSTAQSLSLFANFADRNTDFSWSDSSQDDGHDRTAPAGRYRPNELGLYDMSGNVWEWVWDWYDDSYPSTSERNPMGPSSGERRVLRGGSWVINVDVNLRVANRGGNYPSNSYVINGFRLVAAPAR